ncbi:hypothetical protein [uncultured Oscillibacter sp.]|nr:hypothetical protein [uncultured Oscillibacter sp.]
MNVELKNSISPPQGGESRGNFKKFFLLGGALPAQKKILKKN